MSARFPHPRSTVDGSLGEGQRSPSAVDRVAEAHFNRLLRVDPAWAIELGTGQHGWGYPDYGPEAQEALWEASLRTRREARIVEAVDDVDRVTLHALREHVDITRELHDLGLAGDRINGISSPVQKIRETFDNLPKNTPEDWDGILHQLHEVPGAVRRLLDGVAHRQQVGPVSAAAQLLHAADQAESYATSDGAFLALTHRPAVVRLPARSQDRLREAVAEARVAYTGLAEGLRGLAETAPTEMAVGREEYGVRLRQFTGARLDLTRVYEWGIEQLRAVVSEMRQTARQIVPDHHGRGLIRAAMKALDADVHRQLHGPYELTAWMQGVSQDAIDALAGSHFEITEPMKRLECRIAPTNDGGIYYTPPSPDFTRPGRMWWSVTPGTSVFRTWGERTTVYHEGVPGHHLQMATAVAAGDTLNAWRRVGLWVSGHGEGWALYAERLMAELGYFQDPGDRMGMLNAMRMRAARVVFDVGFHCGLPVPRDLDGLLGSAAGATQWSPATGWAFLKENIVMAEAALRFEWLRYMGWPGQAPSYQIGMHRWQEARQTWGKARGRQFNLPEFHRESLSLGSLGLDSLDYALNLKTQALHHAP
ncbi:DUF885 domain-containing protein [Kocuria sp. JC486]|uniref:DUF885 domain-containing protein n=1 Tax=Kocuria soli TaxID=2485125 RepID=A0A3N3ZQ97_9MICC|nr:MULTISPECIES: DUF885 domain-containing protein [Kocuria]NHU84956.1 DUF885 domain-containing protein [Kocuria sp. JC486]ROZ63324.1 DUF885 domain-containing protein [Kocuria soli]